ncbi:MAG TPA: enoyl-ACP reductase FabI [Actinomycetota bacterium]|nr:enoyl-ACP reductase FabI [Actinomycetota bacterium]
MTSGLLDGKRILVTGVLTPRSIAFDVARLAQEQGAEIVLTGFGKGMALTQRSARRLPSRPDVLEMDVNDDAQVRAVADELGARWGRVDGLLHAIAFAPADALGGNFLDAPYASVETAFRTSAYSLKALAVPLAPMMSGGGSIVSLDFDATVAWPIYDWMGVAKAGLEAVTRYLARDLGPRGVRVNCVSAGPLRTMAAKGIPGFDGIADGWARRAPLGWDPTDPEPVARSVLFLLSDWSSGVTGEIVHVDGGYHAMGSDLVAPPQAPDAAPPPSPDAAPDGGDG